MSSIDRQNRFFVAEDWKKIYQTFRNAEFKSYDFDNLRRIMISYLKENYPEDFNDYIESSEYIALIDLIAFLGQNLSFRIDLNARENFIELAERKESVLRLARLLSYNPKRNQCASGLLKVTAISTTEDIISSRGVNLRGQTVIWNDSVNDEWRDQFDRVLNAALTTDNQIGNPIKAQKVHGIGTSQYQIKTASNNVPAFPFRRTINGSSLNFEVVSADIGDDIVEYAPKQTLGMSLLYRTDNQGPSSNNTGFFCMFKQGELYDSVFDINNNVPNQMVSIDVPNINDTDVWLYSLDSEGTESHLWNKLDTVNGNSIYNTASDGNVFSVLTRADDKINLMFSDGAFGNIPFGRFRVYYRVSKNQNVIIEPSSMRNITITIPYISKRGVPEKVTITLSLKYTVNNSSKTESIQSIRRNAPSSYYTQNRLITAEDYQLGIGAISQEIIKSKTVNRSSNGISRYYDLIDPTGKYSSVTLFGGDGVLYKRYQDLISQFSFSSENDVEGIIYNNVEPLFSDASLVNYYMDQFPRASVRDFEVEWQGYSSHTNTFTGRFMGANGEPVRLGQFSSSNLKYMKFGSIAKFIPPSGHVFYENQIIPYVPGTPNISHYKWAKIVNVVDDGTVVPSNAGPVTINEEIPNGAIVEEIITPLPIRMTDDVRYKMIQKILTHKTFGLRYFREKDRWDIIDQNNINEYGNFSTLHAGDNTNKQLDASWFMLFKTTGTKYTMRVRSLDYIFESDKELQFYYDSSRHNNIEPDTIDILPINTMQGSSNPIGKSQLWEIEKEYYDLSGYTSNKKVILSLYDSDQDGIVDDPDIFKNIVDERTNSLEKLVFMKSYKVDGIVNDYTYVPRDSLDVIVFERKSELRNFRDYEDGQLFYFARENVFENLNHRTMSLLQNTDYYAYYGRDKIQFKYVHHADHNSRIDPGRSNILDAFILTESYDREFRNWLDGSVAERPLPPSENSLKIAYDPKLRNTKSMSDNIVYHTARYRVLFGSLAAPSERAVFKVVKNTEIFINDNELKSNIVSSIKQFFSIENWDFGDTFHFSELSAYVMSQVSPSLKSFLIVPLHDDLRFGALHEIKSEPNEIFACHVGVNDIEIISEVTEERIKSLYHTTSVMDLNTTNQITSSYG